MESGLVANATGGRERIIAGVRFNTADVVNQAIAEGHDDYEAARAALMRLGHRNPSEELIGQYAQQARVLGNIDRIVRANVRGQIGKWRFETADSIHRSFNAYLDRRIAGQHQRYTKQYGKRR